MDSECVSVGSSAATKVALGRVGGMLIMGTTMGKAMHVWGRESIRNLYFPLSFAVNLKLSLKIKTYLKNSNILLTPLKNMDEFTEA